MKKIKSKNLISISIAGAFLVVAITGVLMYFFKHGDLTASLHTLFGMAFVLYAIFHLKNNWKSLKAYSVNAQRAPADPKQQGVSASGLKSELMMSLGILLLVFFGVYYQLAPFSAVYNWGNTFRTGQQRNEGDQLSYIRMNINTFGEGDSMLIDLRKGPYFEYPTYAFWLEDTTGKYLQTLYVTGKLAKNNFTTKVVSENGEDIFIDEPETRHLRERPEALPVWAHQYGVTSSRGNSVPDGEQEVPDGYSGATMFDNFLLRTRADQKLPQKFVIKFEINHSFDWNEFYTPDRYPDDPIYSGNGKVGQPSLVYAAHIDRTSAQKYYAMTLIGRGHHSGQDGRIYSDLSQITTAKQLVDRVIIEL